MHKTLPSLEPETALVSLCAEPAADFGARLLARADGPVIPFRTFVQTARDLLQAEPERTATWLAALVALQMCAEHRHREPRPNSN